MLEIAVLFILAACGLLIILVGFLMMMIPVLAILSGVYLGICRLLEPAKKN